MKITDFQKSLIKEFLDKTAENQLKPKSIDRLANKYKLTPREADTIYCEWRNEYCFCFRSCRTR